MTRRVVLFGATGYTGELAARAMVARGLRPVLAGRDRKALEALAVELGGLTIAVADVNEPGTVRALVERGDVLVTTVGPMTRLGGPALEAALDAGAHYVDSSGESAFVRHVFERADARARATGSLVLSATAYDSVPGNLAGALALREAGETASRVRIGYFVTGARRGGLLGGLAHMSGGSRATFAAMATEPGFAWRGGRIVSERGSARVGVFEVDGQRRRGVSFGTSEAYSLPRIHPNLRDVEVYFGWFEDASRLIQLGSLAVSGLRRVRPMRLGLTFLSGHIPRGASGGPSDEATGSLFIAEALGPKAPPARVSLAGVNGYVFSGRMLAWAAEKIASGHVAAAGALGPVEAFGLDALKAGVADCGIQRRG